MDQEQAVARHYASDGIAERLLSAVAGATGKQSGLTPDDLAPVDQLHGRGLTATRDMTRLLAPRPGERLLDIGCGIGGPARWIAAHFACQVTGIDLTEAFCEAARRLNEATGMQEAVEIRQASALELPFKDGSFDAAYAQNVVMNIADKARFYAEAWRALKPGGRLALSNLARGDGEAVYPVPWAETPATSFLSSPDETREALLAAGFVVDHFEATTERMLRFHAEQREQIRQEGPPRLGPHLLMGERMKEMQRNAARNIEDGRVLPPEILCHKP